MIKHVLKKEKEENIGKEKVEIKNKEQMKDVKKNGGQAILTEKDHKTGTDRIYEAFQKLNNKNIDLILNLQGDEPLMDIEDIRNLNNQMIKNQSQLGTLAAKITDKVLYENENIVKVCTIEQLDDLNFPKATNFTRKISEQDENIYHHLGIYCYSKEILKEFVSFNQSSNEVKSRLEQLRALDNNIDINVALAKSSPIGVDTEEDFLAIKKIMEYKT